MAAVIGDDHILRSKRGAHTRADGLLPRAEDHHSGDFSLDSAQLGERLFEPAGKQQRFEHLQLFSPGYVHRLSSHRKMKDQTVSMSLKKDSTFIRSSVGRG